MLLNDMTDRVDQRTNPSPRPLIIVTEGVLDISCLTTISQIAHATYPQLPDLCDLSTQGRVVFLPTGGGDLIPWITRLAPLNCREFFLCDREQQPETTLRQHVVEQLNRRAGCYAALTSKRSLENYLHPRAIAATFGVEVEIGDDTPVAETVAQLQIASAALWWDLSRRARQRLIHRVKQRLNKFTVQHMTLKLLAEQDPAGEVLGWLHQLSALLL